MHAEYFCDVMFMLAYHGRTRSVVGLVVVGLMFCYGEENLVSELQYR